MIYAKLLPMLVLLAGCSEGLAPMVAQREPSSAAAQAPSRDASGKGATNSNAAATLPGDACTRAGYWSFFETFVQTPEIRRAYTIEGAQGMLDAFDVAQVDSRWVRASDHEVSLDIREQRTGDRLVIEATPVELDADDEIVRPLGSTRRYVFEFKDGCWRFAGSR